MCYSAQIRADFHKYARRYGADIDIREFFRLYWLRDQGARIRIPKAMDAAFAHPRSEDESRIRELIEAFDAREAARLEQELFKQRKRLADAERSLAARHSRAASESRRIAMDKVDWSLRKLAALRRREPVDEDSRIFPGWHAPVIAEIDGRRLVMPMRYQCRLAGKPASYDRKFPGTYNARRDSLGGFWRAQFGSTHAVLVVNAFYENVARHAMEQRELAPGEKEENVVLQFRPRPAHDMLVACLWSRWQGADEDLCSFAAITDAPPAEVAAAGHDRCIVPITEANLAAWLRPRPGDTAALQAILDDRDRPYFEHRLAA
jgi:putative SOS response-associated peptidase YedK